MKRKKSWKNKTLSSFAASSILVTGLLPADRIVHAEEGAVLVIQPDEGNPVPKDKEKSQEEQKQVDTKPQEEQKQEDDKPQEDIKSQEKLRGNMPIKTPTDSLQQAETEQVTYYFDKYIKLGAGNRGWQEINGEKYYFGQEGDGTGLTQGQRATGFITINGQKYYFGQKGDLTGLKEGEMQTLGRFEIGDDAYFANKDGTLSRGKVDLGRIKRFYDKTTGKYLFSIRKDGDKYYGNINGVSIHGFWDYYEERYYFGKSGDGTKLAEGQMAKGWFKVGEDWYRTSEDGALNKGTLDWGSEKYFFDKRTGRSFFAIKNIFNGFMKTVFDPNGYGYGPGPNGEKISGWHTSPDNKRYYFFPKEATTVKIHPDKYGAMPPIFHENGHYYKQSIEDGTATRERRLQEISHFFPLRLFSSKSDKVEKTKYLIEFDQDGAIIPAKYDGQKFIDWFNLQRLDDHQKNKNRDIITDGTGFYTRDGKTYYFAEDDDEHHHHVKCKLVTGWKTIKDLQGKERMYYFAEENDDDHHIKEGEMVTGFHTIHGKTYYFGKDGQVKKGIHSVGNDRYFLDNATGECIFSIQQRGYSLIGYAPDGSTPIVGFKEFGGNKYHFNKKDSIRSLEEGELSLGMPLIDDKYYYFSTELGLERGKMLTGFQGQNSGGITKLYYFDPAAKDGVLTGFHDIGGNKYYFGEMDGPLELGLGEMAIGVQIIGGKRYEFEADGRLKS
ncbi:N-acetylmuramoyl-L-alanine amidase family protein [Bacillus mycoides]|uniref:N-acetylmuramoyl-L-alanine amidase family protein n=1 Tax=Bacillus mycoides TaxID=1405 RepID=UPI0037F6BE5B